MHPKSVTIQDVAREAGVSGATASRCLRDHPQQNAATKLKVREAAERLGYRPNPLVSALFEQIHNNQEVSRSATIALIDGLGSSAETPPHPLIGRVWEGATRRLGERGFGVEKFSYSEWRERQDRLHRILRSRGVYGLLFSHFANPRQVLEWDIARYACANFGYSIKRPQVPRSTVHQHHNIRLALDTLRERGYRRPGLAISETIDARTEGLWTGAFFAWCHTHGVLDVSRLCLLPENQDREPASLKQWLEANKMDVVVSPHPTVLQALRGAGRRVPDDLGFVCLNHPGDGANMAGIDILPEIMGEAAADLIIGQLHRNERSEPAHPKTVLIKGQWVEGGTVLGS